VIRKDARDRNGAFFDRAAKTDGPAQVLGPPLGSGNLGPVDVAEKVGILAKRFGSTLLKEPDQKGQIK
jgi:hypothetical protein